MHSLISIDVFDSSSLRQSQTMTVLRVDLYRSFLILSFFLPIIPAGFRLTRQFIYLSACLLSAVFLSPGIMSHVVFMQAKQRITWTRYIVLDCQMEKYLLGIYFLSLFCLCLRLFNSLPLLRLLHNHHHLLLHRRHNHPLPLHTLQRDRLFRSSNCSNCSNPLLGLSTP